MKRLIIILSIFIVTVPAIFAGEDKPIAFSQLPETAKTFVKKHFPNIEVSLAKVDTDIFDKSYEVILIDGSKIDFDGKGNWKEIDCEFSQVPDAIIPEQIRTYIQANYKSVNVLKIDKDRRDYEVKLSNGLELKFNLKFQLIDIEY